jgi:uncharacterized protein (TIGR02588 family)
MKEENNKSDYPNQKATDADQQSSKNSPFASGQSPLEWLSFAIALAILGTVLGTVIYLWIRDRNPTPPTLDITSHVEIRQGKYYVPFTVSNSGDETAESVHVVAELRENGEVVEWGEQQIDFLSSKENSEGAFIFTQDPRQGELTVRTASYKLP